MLCRTKVGSINLTVIALSKLTYPSHIAIHVINSKCGKNIHDKQLYMKLIDSSGSFLGNCMVADWIQQKSRDEQIP